jgi:GGDEF domain-containing protein
VTGPAALLARYGGDQLAVLAPGLTLMAAEDLAARLREAVAAAADEVGLRACSGVATWEPGMAAADLLDRALRAAHAAR